MDDIITMARQLGWCWCWSVRNTDDHFDLSEFVVEKPKIFWIMGSAQTGKTSLAKLLAKKTGYELIRPSTLIKQESEKEGYRAGIIKDLIKAKKPVFDEIVINVIKEFMHKTQTTAKGYIIDGFPIDVKQAKLFEFEIYRPSIVVYARLPDDHAMANNNDTDYLQSLNEYHRLHYIYEMKTLKVEMNEKPEMLCEKLVNELSGYWGYIFNISNIPGKNDVANNVLEDDVSTLFSDVLD